MHKSISSGIRCLIAFFAGLAILAGIANAAPGTPSFTGHYELADAKSAWAFSLDVIQTGSKATVSFSASMNDGSGAAPDGDGRGTIDSDGGLNFTFTDSFDNAGTGTLVHARDGYHLTLNTTKVNDPRALRYYGDTLLKKTSAKPAAN